MCPIDTFNFLKTEINTAGGRVVSVLSVLSVEGYPKHVFLRTLQNKTVHDMYYRMYAAWLVLFVFVFVLFFVFSERNWKQQHVCSATNQGQFKNSHNIPYMLSNLK